MKSAMAALSLAFALTVAALAQGQMFRGSRGAARSADSQAQGQSVKPEGAMNQPGSSYPGPNAPSPKTDPEPQVFKASAELPAPLKPEEIGAPTIALPTEPIDNYLLTKDVGPFMVLAHTFRGPDASRYALALVLELRNKFHLPAYIFHLKIQPGRSNIRGVQPTAPNNVRNGQVGAPEIYRTYDEAAVLVGNCKTIDESEDLLKVVKHTKPVCLDGLPSLWQMRKGKGLSRAMLTTNPLTAAQNIFAGKAYVVEQGKAFDPFTLHGGDLNQQTEFRMVRKADPLILQMNGGPHSIYKCNGAYTLQVADFSGRATLATGNSKFENEQGLFKKSRLETAEVDAEHLADILGKSDDLVRAGYQPYVYHDRSSSIVTVGSFNSPNDPRLQPLRKMILDLATKVNQRKEMKVPMVPSATLMPVPRP